MIFCPECGKEVTGQHLVCISCGCVIDESEILINNLSVRYKLFYDLIIGEEESLKQADVVNNYKICKALAACYELQDYLANRIAEYGIDV